MTYLLMPMHMDMKINQAKKKLVYLCLNFDIAHLVTLCLPSFFFTYIIHITCDDLYCIWCVYRTDCWMSINAIPTYTFYKKCYSPRTLHERLHMRLYGCGATKKNDNKHFMRWYYDVNANSRIIKSKWTRNSVHTIIEWDIKLSCLDEITFARVTWSKRSFCLYNKHQTQM